MKTISLSKIILAFLALVASSAGAVPSITGVSGEVSHGEPIVISGDSFGTGATILTWDDFEGGTVGQSLSGQSPSIGFSWNVDDDEPQNDHDVTYSDERAKFGNQSLRWWLNSREQLFFGWVNKGPYKELYWSYWIYQRMQYNGQDCSTYVVPDQAFNYKRGYTYGRGERSGPQVMVGAITQSRPKWTIRTQAYGDGAQKQICESNPSHYYASGICNWDRFEVFLRSEDDGQSNGAIKFWVNNSTAEPDCFYEGDTTPHDCEGLDISSWTGTAAWVHDWRLGYLLRPYWAYDYVQAWYDNIYCATSRARVEIGNNSVWGYCTRRAIQPHSVWAPGSVTVTVNTGDFIEGEEAWLYLIDEDGDVSSGHRIEIGSGIEPPDAPTSPTGLSAQNGPESAVLNWNDNPGSDNVSSYYVYRSDSSGGTYEEIASTTLSGYTNSNLEPGVIQYYKVKAENTGGRSGFSNIASATPYADPPAAPNNLVGDGGILHADLSWDSNNDEPDLDGYYVYRGDILGAYTKIPGLLGTTTYTYTDTDVQGGETYFYVVRAADVWGNESVNSNYQEVEILDEPDDPPSAPTNLIADNSVPEEVTLSWDTHPNPDEDLAGYYIYRSDLSGPPYEGLPIGDPDLLDVTYYTDTEVAAGQTYFYVVQAADLGGNRSLDSNEVEVEVEGVAYPPAAPTGVQATKGVELVDLLWLENTEEDLAGYFVFWDDDSGGPYTQVNKTAISDTFYSHTGLVGGDTYYYVIQAVDDDGFRSLDSTEVSATPDTIPDVSPDPPTGLEGTDGVESAYLTWDEHPDPDEDLAGYHVFRRDFGTHGFRQITTTGAELTDEEYLDEDLTAFQIYYYAIQAIDDGDNRSTLSDSVGVLALPVPNPPPAAPTGLEGTAGVESASLVWADNDEADLAGYYVYRATSPGDEFVQQNPTIQGDTTYVDAPLVGGATYYYKVKAADTALQRSDFSDTVSVTALVVPDEAPDPPTGLVGVPGIERATLAWAEHPDPDGDLAGYNVWWSEKEGGGYFIDNDVLITTESYIDSSLTAHKSYYYVVQAQDDGGNRSKFSEEVEVVPLAEPIAPNVLAPDSLEVVTARTMRLPVYAYWGFWPFGTDSNIALDDDDYEWAAQYDVIHLHSDALRETRYDGFVDSVRARNPDIIVLFYMHLYGFAPEWEGSDTYSTALMDLGTEDDMFIRNTYDGGAGDLITGVSGAATILYFNPLAAGLADSLGAIFYRSLAERDNDRPYVGVFGDYLARPYPRWASGMGDSLNYADFDQDGDNYPEDPDEETGNENYIDGFAAAFRAQVPESTFLIVPNLAGSRGDILRAAASGWDGAMYEIFQTYWPTNTQPHMEEALTEIPDLFDNSRVSLPLLFWQAGPIDAPDGNEIISAVARGISAYHLEGDPPERINPPADLELGRMVGVPTWAGDIITAQFDGAHYDATVKIVQELGGTSILPWDYIVFVEDTQTVLKRYGDWTEYEDYSGY